LRWCRDGKLPVKRATRRTKHRRGGEKKRVSLRVPSLVVAMRTKERERDRGGGGGQKDGKERRDSLLPSFLLFKSGKLTSNETKTEVVS